MSDKYNKSLLILDDVWTLDIIRAFSISARVLITTRYQDQTTVSPGRSDQFLNE
jgi:hypothetical protein